jgi:hypothetical protein
MVPITIHPTARGSLAIYRDPLLSRLPVPQAGRQYRLWLVPGMQTDIPCSTANEGDCLILAPQGLICRTKLTGESTGVCRAYPVVCCEGSITGTSPKRAWSSRPRFPAKAVNPRRSYLWWMPTSRLTVPRPAPGRTPSNATYNRAHFRVPANERITTRQCFCLGVFTRPRSFGAAVCDGASRLLLPVCPGRGPRWFFQVMSRDLSAVELLSELRTSASSRGVPHLSFGGSGGCATTGRLVAGGRLSTSRRHVKSWFGATPFGGYS